MTWRAFAVLALVACAGAKTMEKLPICSSMADCRARDGERVHVIAVYSVWDPMPMRPDDHAPSQLVVLKFGAEEGPYLGAWGRDHARALDEISRFNGRKVRVTGRFHAKMPPHPSASPDMATLSGPCVHPVEQIELLESRQ